MRIPTHHGRMQPWVLVIGAVGVAVLGLGVLVYAGGPGFSPARHAWTIEIDPESDDASWTVRIPSLAPDGGPDPALEKLLATLRVAEGNATVHRLADEAVLLVAGQGPARVEAERVFRDRAERERFTTWEVPESDVVHEGPRESAVRVTWRVDFSGGSGHTCWASATHVVDVPPLERRPLFSTAETSPTPPPPGRPFMVACA